MLLAWCQVASSSRSISLKLHTVQSLSQCCCRLADQVMRKFRCDGARATTVVAMALVLAMSLDVAHGIRRTPAGWAGAVTGETAAPLRGKGRGDETPAREEEAEAAVTGSRLPDCTHACGACSPCKRVMVSFRCAEAADAESCPIAYRCMCRGRFFHVPTV